jgi:hypothetical protein
MAREVEITAFLPLAKRLKALDKSDAAIAFLLRHYYGILEDERAAEALENDRRREKEEGAKKAKRRAEASRELAEKAEKRGRNTDKKESRPARKADTPDDPDYYRLFINRGSDQGFDEDKLKNLVVEIAECGEVGALKKVQVRRTHAFVQVPVEIADKAVERTAKGVEIDDMPVTIERARTR